MVGPRPNDHSTKKEVRIKSELQRYTVLSRGLPVKERDRAAGTKKYIYVYINGRSLNKLIAFWRIIRDS